MHTLRLCALYTGILCTLGACTGNQTQNTSEEALSIDSTELQANTSAEETPSTQQEAAYMEFYYQMGSRSPLQGLRLSGETAPKAYDKLHFEYNEQWLSIDANKEGITYTAIYERNPKGRVLRFASIIPEIEMEAGTYVNYENESWYSYTFDKGQLDKIIYTDPANQQTEQVQINDADMPALGDSLKRLFNAFFQIDSSTSKYNAEWQFSGNNEEYSLHLRLDQIGSFVFGEYCAYTSNKNDCGTPEQGAAPCYVNAYVSADSLSVEFLSCYAMQKGNASAYLRNDSLLWKTHYAPEGSLMPEEAVFVKFQ